MTDATVETNGAPRRRFVSLPVLGLIALIAVVAIGVGVWFALTSGGDEATENAEIEVPAEASVDEYAEIEAELVALLEENPNDIDAHRLLASVLAKQGKYEDAIREYNRVIDARPEDADALYEVAILQRQSGLTDDALRSLETAVGITGDVKHLDEYARTCMQVGKFDEAIDAWKRVLESEDLTPEVRANTLGALSQAYQDAKLYDEAKAALQEAVALMPDDANLKARLEAMEN